MGLEALLNKRETVAAKNADRLGKDDRFKVEKGQSAEVVFLQELADTADTHQVDEWVVSGNGEFRTVVDSTEAEGGCYAAEIRTRLYEHASKLNEADKKAFLEKYSAKLRHVVYFSVVKVSDPGKPLFFSQAINSPVVSSLLDDINDGDNITDAVYRISKGNANSDSWTIKRLPKAELPTVTAEPFEIRAMAPIIPLSEQPRVLAKVEPPRNDSAAPRTESAPPAAAASTDW